MRTKTIGMCIVAAMLALSLGACGEKKKGPANVGPMGIEEFTAASQNVAMGKLLDVSVANNKIAGRIQIEKVLRGQVSDKMIEIKNAKIEAGDASSLTPGTPVYIGFDAKKSGVYENMKIMKDVD